MLPAILSLLSFPSYVKLIHKVLSCYISYTNDPETILTSLIKSGYSMNWKVRLSSMSIISLMFKDSFSSLSPHLSKTLTAVLEYLSKDSSSLVSLTASKFLEDVKPKPIIEDTSFAYKINVPYGNNANKLNVAPSSVYIDSSSNGLIFNFIQPQVLAEIEDQSN